MSWRRISLAVFMAGFLVGCSPDEGSPDGERETHSGGPTVEEWDAGLWVPPLRVEPEDLSEDERMARRAKWLEENANVPNPPDVGLVAWASSYAEHGRLVTECLGEAGFPGIWDGAGGRYFDPPVPESQEKALNLATYTCEAQYSLDPRILRDVGEDQATIMFDYWTEYYIPCMEAHGHPMNLYREGAPSREAYIAAYSGSDRIEWAPYLASDSLPREDQHEIESVCPRMPPEDFMYGM